jgi:tRNA(Ile)-lysidine synthase
MLMTGRPVRGGGRASGDGLALDVTRLAGLAPALQRRLLRYAAGQLGAVLDFPSTEALRTLALEGRAGQKRELAHGLRAERTPRELRLTVEAAPAFGVRLRIEVAAMDAQREGLAGPGRTATLRNWRPGDRVQLRYSGGPRKVKEVLERMRVTGSGRAVWPVLEVGGRIAWMKGVELEPEQGIAVVTAELEPVGGIDGSKTFGDAPFE